MKSIVKFQLLLVIFLTTTYGQGQFTVTTNKSEYSYGEKIIVEMKYVNNSDSVFSFWGDPYCNTEILFKGTHLDLLCSTLDGLFEYPVGKSQSWVWIIDPKIQGIPVKTGEQTVVGSFINQFIDSTLFTAPKYNGGQIRVSIKNSFVEELNNLKDSINAVVVLDNGCGNFGCEQYWQIEGFSIDSLSTVLNNDYRFNTVETWRPIMLDSTIVTEVNDINKIQMEFLLFHNYPNPFNPTTKIKYELPKNDYVRITISNILGEEMAVLAEGYKTAGSYELEFDGSNYASGIYIYSYYNSERTLSKKMLLIK